MIKVTVTIEDIKAGKQGSIHGCPLALAAQRALGDIHVYSAPNGVFIAPGFYRYIATDPKVVDYWQTKFDVMGYRRGFLGLFPNLRPFSFTIEES